MIMPARTLSLRWRLIITSSISVTVLFGAAGWFVQRYTFAVADEKVKSEIRSSMRAYEAVWKGRTQVLSETSSIISSMSDVRAAFMTRDPQTIRDSAEELWSRVSGSSALFLVFSPDGALITSLGRNSDPYLPGSISSAKLMKQLPSQSAGYVQVNRRLFYVVLTPVYVQGGSSGPVLLNVLCAGFPIDQGVVQQLRSLAPGSDFTFEDSHGHVFATTGPASQRGISAIESLADLSGLPIAQLRISHPYDEAQSSLMQLRRILATTWFATIVIGLLISTYLTRRMLSPLKALDHAAAQIASRNYDSRVPVMGTDELSRFAQTFNEMCDSIQRSQSELLRNQQIATIARLGSSLVHDLRNPLAAIYGGAEMLVDSELPPQQVKRIASTVYNASRRIQELLQDLTSVSRGGARKPELEICRLRDIIEAARESALSGISGTEADISISELLEITADRPRVERVFSNLLTNAEQAMSLPGKIHIYAIEADEFLDVYVQDTGTGISAEVMPRLFEPLATGKGSGLGLGLAFSRVAMREFGGDLLLADSQLGGACFIVRFPKQFMRAKAG